jgi:hypothetical protein
MSEGQTCSVGACGGISETLSWLSVAIANVLLGESFGLCNFEISDFVPASHREKDRRRSGCGVRLPRTNWAQLTIYNATI